MSIELFNRFKEVYPNHGAGYNPKLAQWYAAAINNYRYTEPARPKAIDAALQAAYEKWISNRGVNPKKPGKALTERLKVVLERFPAVQKVYIQGSRAKGDWVDKNTTKKYLELRRKVTGKDKVPSDYDFFTEPTFVGTFGDIQLMAHKTKDAIKIYG